MACPGPGAASRTGSTPRPPTPAGSDNALAPYQIELFHRDDLAVAAARRASLDAKRGALGGLADAGDDLLPQVRPQRLAQPHRGGAAAARGQDGRMSRPLAFTLDLTPQASQGQVPSRTHHPHKLQRLMRREQEAVGCRTSPGQGGTPLLTSCPRPAGSARSLRRRYTCRWAHQPACHAQTASPAAVEAAAAACEVSCRQRPSRLGSPRDDGSLVRQTNRPGTGRGVSFGNSPLHSRTHLGLVVAMRLAILICEPKLGRNFRDWTTFHRLSNVDV